MPHLVLDSAAIQRHLRIAGFLRNLDKLKSSAADYKKREADAKSGDGEFQTNSLESVLGNPLHHLELMRRLRLCNRNLYFELSTATRRYGIYYPDASSRGTASMPGVRYLGMSIAQGVNPEFTPKILKDDGNLKSVQHGYRTVLARLLRQGFITEPQIRKHFGLPSRDSYRWKQVTT
jgi:hypothetical protein